MRAMTRPALLFTLSLALAGAFTACASPPTLPARSVPAASASPSVKHDEGFFAGSGGMQLYEQSWHPQGESRAALVVVHGLRDHSSRYAGLAARLVEQGDAVYAFDLRGHGQSAGMRVDIESFDDYLDDLDIFLERVHAREPKNPVFVLGYSMGGAIVTLYAIKRDPHDIRGLLLGGAALRVDAPSPLLFGTRVFATLAPRMGLFNLEVHDFSRDPAVVAANLADPLIYQEGAPVHTAEELVHAIDDIDEHMQRVTLPLLIMHGSADKVTPPEGSKELARRARSWDKTLDIYDGLYHDLLHEPEKDRVMGDIAQWIADRSGTPGRP
jgi:alpha-beta hydrolase superfamily lysophospholipase